MLKDYRVPKPEDAASETECVAGQWDRAWNTPKIEAQRLSQSLVRDRKFRRLLAVLSRFEHPRVLDAGCGLGHWTLALNERGIDVTGIDIAPDRVVRLQHAYGARLFGLMDFRSTDWPPQTFDVIFNWGGAEHFEEGVQSTFAEAYRLLRENGRFLVTTPAHNLRHMLRGFRQPPGEACSPMRRFYQYRFTPAELRAELTVAGFAVEEMDLISKLEGARRMLQHDLQPLGRFLPLAITARVFASILPKQLVAHMLFAIARHP